MSQKFLNEPADCQWLRETALKDANLNNGPVPAFKSFCLFGNEDCPKEILLYATAHASVNDRPTRAMLMDNGCYSLFPV